jgi:hypothetical protein
VQLIALDDLHRGLQALLYAVSEGLAGVESVKKSGVRRLEVGTVGTIDGTPAPDRY